MHRVSQDPPTLSADAAPAPANQKAATPVPANQKAATPTKRKTSWKEHKTPSRKKKRPRNSSDSEHPDSEPSEPGDVQPDVQPAPTTWKKNRARRLIPAEESRLQDAMLVMSAEPSKIMDGTLVNDDGTPSPLIYPFVHRVCKEYAALHTKNKGRGLHCHREKYTGMAVLTVL